jgi:hypothetical protein
MGRPSSQKILSTFSAVLKLTDAVGAKHAVHFMAFSTPARIPGSVVNPIVPPLICTDVAVTFSAGVANLTEITPPRLYNHFLSASVGATTEIAVNMLIFLLTPM